MIWNARKATSTAACSPASDFALIVVMNATPTVILNLMEVWWKRRLPIHFFVITSDNHCAANQYDDSKHTNELIHVRVSFNEQQKTHHNRSNTAACPTAAAMSSLSLVGICSDHQPSTRYYMPI